MTSMHLLQMSGIVTDLVYSVRAVPQAGQEAIVDGFSISPGGGFNAMIAAKRAGMEVSYGGALGTGPFADIVIRELTGEGIPYIRAQTQSRDQGCCTVLVDTQGERTFISSPGAEGWVSDDDLIGTSLEPYGCALLSGYSLHYPGSRDAFRSFLQSQIRLPLLVFDPSPVVAILEPENLRAALARATWVSANAREAAVLTGCSDPVAAAKSLAQSRPEEGGAVVRNGPEGCVVATRMGTESIPAIDVDVIDSNGAGDTHVGSFIAELARSGDPVAAARYANIAAGLSATQKGPATAPDRSAVERLMEKRTQHF